MTTSESRAKAAAARRKLSRGQVFRLILRTYGASAPYIVVFVAVMLIATWTVTELFW